MKIVFYAHLHQPWRLARFRYLDLGSGRSYFDVERNLAIFRRIAEQCYRPAMGRLYESLERHPEFRFSLSITGTWIEQAREAAPDLIEQLRKLVGTGRVALLAETYYHSLAFLVPPPELEEEVALHGRLLQDTFGVKPAVLRMTELAYSDELARFGASHGYRGMLAEGWEGVLGGRSPTHRYTSSVATELSVLLRHYRLSDDVGFRFSSKAWSEYPLTSEKYARWIASTPGDLVGIFLDFETFGEHHPASTGILEFLSALPAAAARESNLGWATVEDALTSPSAGPFSAPVTLSWADQNRDLGAWLGNDLQRSAFEAAKKAGLLVRRTGDTQLLERWRKLLTSDHFYYMYLGGHGADLGVHQYFSSYGSPYDAYANYMNALTDLRDRALEELR
ncbi:MAG: glycoside hydrolase family 57 protein [Thermoplasmata archaeon]|nr:glycoside hydrolase family 57 protein [Thermoplasmata archaeon]MCI4338650.1 glycoside hydrolase family 57 protein [Thermoplasmata archaeon]MCI4340819.1 glycoside hydrolase family 57 protein [Thermoplasmata archaeon]